MFAKRWIVGLLAAALLVPGATWVAAEPESTLSRSDSAVVLTGADVPDLQGAEPADVVAFRWTGGAWEQVPVQVDERHEANLRDAYPNPMTTPCGDPCYNPGNRRVDWVVYSDPKTLIGPDPDPTLDELDEIALMVKDTGAARPGGAVPPAGVLGIGVELIVTDPADGGVGHVTLFERDPDADELLDPSAGRSYVTYRWVVDHIAEAHPDDPDATENHYATEYRFNGHDGSRYAGNPESSWVETAHYRREMTGRWHDNVLVVKRGVPEEEQVDILQRHDASITFDIGGLRNQGTFDVGEMAYVTSKAGPVRAIREYLGTNSGPLTQRQHIFYESSEQIRVDLRVHAIPGASDIWNYNENAVGMRASTGVTSDRVDGQQGPHLGGVVVLPGMWRWETLDRDTADDPNRGALTHVVYYDSNNPPPLAHHVYRDGGSGGSPNAPYFGSSHAQGPLVLTDTDATSSGANSIFLYLIRNVHYEEAGTTDGAARLEEATTPLEVEAVTRP